MSPLTDAPATILTPEQLATIEAAHGVYDGVGWHTVEKMLASHRALIARLAEIGQQRDRAERWYTEAMATFTVFRKQHITLTDQLATAQATIERLTTALREIQSLKLGVRETCDCRICQVQRIANTALAPEAADGD